jgi:hypothetical protein
VAGAGGRFEFGGAYMYGLMGRPLPPPPPRRERPRAQFPPPADVLSEITEEQGNEQAQAEAQKQAILSYMSERGIPGAQEAVAAFLGDTAQHLDGLLLRDLLKVF